MWISFVTSQREHSSRAHRNFVIFPANKIQENRIFRNEIWKKIEKLGEHEWWLIIFYENAIQTLLSEFF